MDAGINHGGVEPAVAKQGLDRRDFAACIDQLGGIGSKGGA